MPQDTVPYASSALRKPRLAWLLILQIPSLAAGLWFWLMFGGVVENGGGIVPLPLLAMGATLIACCIGGFAGLSFASTQIHDWAKPLYIFQFGYLALFVSLNVVGFTLAAFHLLPPGW